MAKGFFKGFATVYTENGAHKVMLPDGRIIPYLVRTMVDDGVETATVTFQIACNVARDKDEAIRLYDENKDQKVYGNFELINNAIESK